MPTIEDITALTTEAELRLAEAREMAVEAQNALKKYNTKQDGSLDEKFFQETISYIDKASRALPGEIVDWGI